MTEALQAPAAGPTLVWQPEEAQELREQRRLLGAAIGAVPGLAQQNAVHGLPVLLMPEEAAVRDAAAEAAPGPSGVFADLHGRGYHLTAGSKFGADFLLYPADPSLYHAQFCVREVPAERPLRPALLSAAIRCAHSSRKHLVLASQAGGGAQYLTLAPERGFKAAKPP